MFRIEQRTKNKEKKRKFFQTEYVFILFSLFFSLAANAQCAMCRAALAGDSNVKKAQAVNDGIVYLMVIPYLLVGIIGILIYRMYQSKKKKAE
ncbi:hypothetical protein [Flavobacterium sp. CF136]|jgi:hypothetical protein|uniref:hypothetical protein n=1 Tax=Flavobacterium sp. (strain CF136) TaxID=1144313 RepID=UPI0002716C12|nr:hypothetical protein [Flavobacterium sp. CF136]EJL59332.1 hypothetical protein PMI10_04236 [Flavobacterium sp. CF136]